MTTVPIDLSGRTSYLRVRLAFYPYPQVIRANCNSQRFGPPPDLRRDSPCSWIDHPVSGPSRSTNRLFRLGFPTSSSAYANLDYALRNDSPAHSSIGTTLPCTAQSY